MANERILVVDDSAQINHFIVEEVLKPNGYDALTARDGVEGLQVVRQQRPDLILLDLQMPKMDGIQVLKRLKSEKHEIPVILMTGYGSEAIAIEVFRLGVRDYIIKPFDTLEMLESINRALNEVRLQKQTEQLTEDLLISNSELKKVNEELMVANFHLQHRLKELNILYNIGEEVTKAPDINTLMMRVISAATMLTQSEECTVYLMEDDDLVRKAAKYASDDRPQLFPTAEIDMLGDPLAVQVVETNKPRRVSQPKGGTDTQQFTGAIAAPIAYADAVIGAVVVKNYGKDAHKYNKHDTALLKALANYAAMAIDAVRKGGTERVNGGKVPAAIEQKRIFVSYSRADWDAFVSPLVDRLTAEGFRIWIDQDGLEGGQNWLDKINEALNMCDYMVLCITPRALSSLYVKFEYRYYIHEGKPLLPLICEETRMPAELINIQTIQYNESDKLISRLRALMRK